MGMDDELRSLAELIRRRNEIGAEVTRLTRRPMQIGHLGEYIASRIFEIDLEASATTRGFDGRFRSGALKGKTVNIKWYAKWEGLLDLPSDGKEPADFYLVLAGPKGSAARQLDQARPWVIEAVYLFDGPEIVEKLRERGLKAGEASSIAGPLREGAQVWPKHECEWLRITPAQKVALQWFGGTGGEQE